MVRGSSLLCACGACRGGYRCRWSPESSVRRRLVAELPYFTSTSSSTTTSSGNCTTLAVRLSAVMSSRT